MEEYTPQPEPTVQQVLMAHAQNTSLFSMQVIDNTDILFNLEAAIRNWRIEYRRDAQGQIVRYVDMDQSVKGRMNETGTREVLNFVAMHLNKNTWMSNVNEHETYRDVRSIALDFNDIVASNALRWELNVDFYDMLIDTVTYSIWFAICRAKDGGERKSHKTSIYETTQSQSSDRKPGGMELPFGISIGKK